MDEMSLILMAEGAGRQRGAERAYGIHHPAWSILAPSISTPHNGLASKHHG